MLTATGNHLYTDWTPRLLVIDDDPHAHELTDYYLSTVVTDVIHAMSGDEGINVARQSQPDAILLDIDMPGMDGFHVCRRLKDLDATRNIPVLFLTREHESSHIATALDLGGFDYVTKPFVPVELQARVRSALRNKLASDVLRIQAMSDPLTNLANRRAFDERLEGAIAHFQRNGHPFGLLMLDLDFFKAINDTHGHGVGDEVLVSVGRVLRHTCRPYDVAARCGGEEFALILNETTREEARAIGCRLLEIIRQLSITTNSHTLHVTASAGLAAVPLPSSDVTARKMFELADAALYQAKERGRDRLIVHEGDEQHSCPGE